MTIYSDYEERLMWLEYELIDAQSKVNAIRAYASETVLLSREAILNICDFKFEHNVDRKEDVEEKEEGVQLEEE